MFILKLLYIISISIWVVNGKLSLPRATSRDILSELKNGTSSCERIIKGYLSRIKTFNGKVNAVIKVNDDAINVAKKLDYYQRSNSNSFKGSLHCVPLLIKDNIDVRGMATTVGADALRSSYPKKDATVVSRLRQHGAIIIGKANMALFADGGATSKSEVGGICRNPYDLDRTCYGSSGGSGSGVASGFAVASLGTDTEGSIIGPAGGHSLVGIRPTQDTIPLDGIFPAFLKMDTVGPIARDAYDAAAVWEIISGANNSMSESSLVTSSLSGTKIGILDTFSYNWPKPLWIPFLNMSIPLVVDRDVADAIGDSLKKLESEGANIVHIIDDFNNKTYIDSIFEVIGYGIMAKVKCAKSCKVKDVNAYFQRKDTFPDGPYDSLGRLSKSEELSESYVQKFREAVNITKGKNGSQILQYCNDQCADFQNARARYKEMLDNWFTQNTTVDMLYFPMNVQVTPLEKNARDGISGMGLSPFTGYPSVVFPVGFSSGTKNAPEGLSISAILLGKPESLQTMVKVVAIFQNKYSYSRVPQETPVIITDVDKSMPWQPCRESNSASKSSVFVINPLMVSLLTLTTILYS